MPQKITKLSSVKLLMQPQRSLENMISSFTNVYLNSSEERLKAFGTEEEIDSFILGVTRGGSNSDVITTRTPLMLQVMESSDCCFSSAHVRKTPSHSGSINFSANCNSQRFGWTDKIMKSWQFPIVIRVQYYSGLLELQYIYVHKVG